MVRQIARARQRRQRRRARCYIRQTSAAHSLLPRTKKIRDEITAFSFLAIPPTLKTYRVYFFAIAYALPPTPLSAFSVPSPPAPDAPTSAVGEEQTLEAPVAEPSASTEEAPVLAPAPSTPLSPPAPAEAPAEPAALASEELPLPAPDSTPAAEPDSPTAASPVTEEAVRHSARCCFGEAHRPTCAF